MKRYVTKDQKIETVRILRAVAEKQRDQALERARSAEAKLERLRTALRALLEDP